MPYLFLFLKHTENGFPIMFDKNIQVSWPDERLERFYLIIYLKGIKGDFRLIEAILQCEESNYIFVVRVKIITVICNT